MADSAKILEVLLRLNVIGQADVKAANDLLDNTKDTTADFRKETEKATDATEQYNIHGRAQFLLFSEINRIVPGLGEAMHAAFAGPLGPIILVGIAIAAAKNALDSYNQSLDKMGESAAAGHAEQIQAVRDAWDHVEEGMAKYFTDLQAAAKDRDPTSILIANLKALQEEQFKAEIEQMKLLGRPQAEIDAAKDQHDKKTVALLQEERNLRVADLANAQFAVDKDKERAALADARVASRKAELDLLQKSDPDLEARTEKARKTFEFYQKQLEETKSGGYAEDIPVVQKKLDEAASALGVLENEQRLRGLRAGELTSANQTDLDAKAAADKALADDKSRAVAAQNRITELSGPQGEIAQTALRESVAASGRSAIELITEAKNLVQNHANLFPDIAATLRYYNTHAGSVNSEIAALKNEMAQHARDIEAIQHQNANLPH